MSLAVKLGRPPSLEGLIARPRLLAQLDRAAELPLVTLVAPAGYGKTSLLAEYAAYDPRLSVWLACEPWHTSPTQFLSSLLEAFEQIEPFDEDFARRVRETAQDPVPSILPSLAASLEQRSNKSFALVLDDAHILAESPSLEVLCAIAEHLPRGSQLMLASRRPLALPTGRLRAHRALLELGPRELAMSVEEAAELLSAAQLPRAPAQCLVERTEGWPAGLYLAALSASQDPAPTEALERFGGAAPIVADYLRDEFLLELPAPQLRFLRLTSVCDELSGSLCDALLRRRDSVAMLDEIAGAGFPLFTGEHDSYRLHPLLREALRAELRHLDPAREVTLHRRALDHLAARGDFDRAIDHACAAPDPRRAGELMWTHLPHYLSQGRLAFLRTRLAGFDPGDFADQPALALAAAYTALAFGELRQADHFGLLSAAALARLSEPPQVPSLTTGLALIQALAADRSVAPLGRSAAQAYDLEAEDSPWRSICCLLQGVSDHLRGDSVQARDHLEQGVRRSAVAAPHVETLCLSQLAVIAVEEGDWDGSGELIARAVRQVERHGLASYPTAALTFAVSADVRAHAGRVDEGKRDARRAAHLLGELSDFIPWYEAETRIMLARAALRLADVTAARALLAEASRLARRVPDAVVFGGWLQDTWDLLDSAATAALAGPASLTMAELRILRFLPTHLSLREIGLRLHVSTNTVKTQAHAVYRKLQVSSRSDAVARAAQIGLLEP